MKLIENDGNQGFAAATFNQGARKTWATGSDFILLLNPDAHLLTPIAGLVDACRISGMAFSAGKPGRRIRPPAIRLHGAALPNTRFRAF